MVYWKHRPLCLFLSLLSSSFCFILFNWSNTKQNKNTICNFESEVCCSALEVKIFVHKIFRGRTVALTRNISLLTERIRFLQEKTVVLISVEWANEDCTAWKRKTQTQVYSLSKLGFCQANHLVWRSLVLLSSSYADCVYLINVNGNDVKYLLWCSVYLQKCLYPCKIKFHIWSQPVLIWL